MKNLFFAFLCLVFTTTAFSQVKVRPGVKLGLNFANLSNVYQSSNKLGVNGGLFVNAHLSRFYELQVETTYSEQGTTFNYNSRNVNQIDNPTFFNNEQDVDLEYISLSVANKFFPVKHSGFNLLVGPSIDVLVSENVYDTYLPIDLSLFGGVGYEFPFGLGLELRYKQGLLDIRDDYYAYDYDYDEDYYNSDTVLNGVIQIGATYRFGF